MIRKWFSYFPFLLIVPALFLLLLGGGIDFKQLEENTSDDGDDLIFTLAEVLTSPAHYLIFFWGGHLACNFIILFIKVATLPVTYRYIFKFSKVATLPII